MKRPVTFRKAAREEFDEAYDWYEEKRAGLGDAFAACVQEVLDGISATPEMHQCIFNDARRAVVRGFPYSVIYRVKPNRIVVLAVFHGKRDPEVWQSRV